MGCSRHLPVQSTLSAALGQCACSTCGCGVRAAQYLLFLLHLCTCTACQLLFTPVLRLGDGDANYRELDVALVWYVADCSAPNLTSEPRVMINVRYTPTSTFEKGRLPRDPILLPLFRSLRPQVQDLYRASLATNGG